MKDKYNNRRKWMWVAFLTPVFFIVIGISFSMVVGIMSSNCPIMIGDTVLSMQTIPTIGGGGAQPETSEFCKNMNYLGTDIGPKIAFVGSAILIPALLAGVVLFFMSRRPRVVDVSQDSQ
jgi:hypothetical protein